jgi:HEPN domain-containing protein
MNWEEAMSEFVVAIEDRRILTKAEIVAYSNKYTKREAENMVELGERLSPFISLKDFLVESFND